MRVGTGRDEVKLLQPKDVPGELARLKSKADIKAEVTMRPFHGRPVVFKGVIRNGKLIERFIGRRFVPQRTVDHPQCGVRLWWVDGSSGWIFFRYSNIRSLALTGVLTPEERREILERLKAKREKKAAHRKAVAEDELEKTLERMSPADLGTYLLAAYPAKQGWDQKKLQQLKRRQLIENQPLTREEAIFVKYFPALIRARLDALKRARKKSVIEFDRAKKQAEEAPAPQAAPPLPVPSEDG